MRTVDTRPLEHLQGLGLGVPADDGGIVVWKVGAGPCRGAGQPLPGGYGQSTASAMSVVRAWSSRLTGASR